MYRDLDVAALIQTEIRAKHVEPGTPWTCSNSSWHLLLGHVQRNEFKRQQAGQAKESLWHMHVWSIIIAVIERTV